MQISITIHYVESNVQWHHDGRIEVFGLGTDNAVWFQSLKDVFLAVPISTPFHLSECERFVSWRGVDARWPGKGYFSGVTRAVGELDSHASLYNYCTKECELVVV